MAEARRGATSGAVGAIVSHSFALPRLCLTQIHYMHLNPCSSTIRPLGGSHDKVDVASCPLIGIWATERHRLHGVTVKREG
jgi:hypothetical protein